MKRKKPRGRQNQYENPQEERTIEALGDLAEFERFQAEVLPKLRDAVLNKGASAKDILDMVQTVAAARLGTMVVTEQDSGKALAAIKDILDRTQGKATEKREISHKFEKLKEEELDALLQSRLNEVEDHDRSEDSH